MATVLARPEEVVLRTWEPALKRSVLLGKFAQLNDDRWAYLFDKDPSKRLQSENAWGIAPCVLDAMAERGIEVIRVYVRDVRSYTLEITRQEVLERGKLCSFAGRRTANYHVPEAYWRRVRTEKTNFITKYLDLAWVEHRREPEAKQERLL
jgi:hypothetical protein